MKRDLIAVIWSLLVTGAISKWAFHVAYLERGYKAVGGEYLVILVAYVAAWKAFILLTLQKSENCVWKGASLLSSVLTRHGEWSRGQCRSMDGITRRKHLP